MDFGFYLTAYAPDPARKPFARIYDELLEQAGAAEDLGFSSISIPEHHFANYLPIPHPLILAASVAERTRTVRIATAVLVLPLYNLLRLAGEIAFADHLTGGRLDLGVGRGAFRYEFDRFGVDVEETQPRFIEAVEQLQSLLAGTNVTVEGEFNSVDLPTTIMPRPLQQPHPPLWMAVLSPPSIKWAVEQGYNVQTTPLRGDRDVSRQQAAVFREAVEAGGSARSRLKLQMLRNVWVSKDRRDVRRKADLLLENHRRFTNLFTTAGTVHDGLAVPAEADISAQEAAARVIFGTPDEVIEQIREHQEDGVHGIQCNMSFGADHDETLKAMELFQTEVAPALETTQVA
jgi:alkanesulfonate monooxygenase SsuD/methylene tetrahydromethanopterin reductase-like flavin-dependent oxidoreductase (luciferase family)